MEKLEIKIELLEASKRYLEERFNNAKFAMEAAQQAANNEEKSTAGDKYDTSRAMNHRNRDMNAKQVAEAMDALNMVKAIDISKIYEKVKAGSVIRTKSVSYFISASLGILNIKGNQYFAISPLAPIAQALLNHKKGDSVFFNSKEIIIEEVF